MKKLISIPVILIALAILLTTVVNASTNSTLADDLYNIGSKYGMTTTDKLRIQRYLTDYPVNEDQANQVVTKAKKAATVFEETGKTSFKELTSTQKEQLKTIANEAASILDITLVFKADSVDFYKNGKLIEVVTYENEKLVYTGNNLNTILVVSSVAVVALTVGIIARKKFANA